MFYYRFGTQNKVCKIVYYCGVIHFQRNYIPLGISAHPPSYLRPVFTHLVLAKTSKRAVRLGAELVCKRCREFAGSHKRLTKRRVIVVRHDFAVGRDVLGDIAISIISR